MDLKNQNANINMVLAFPALMALPYDRVADGVDAVFASKVPVFGGISMDNMATTSTQFIDDKVIEKGIVAVGFADPTLELVTRACHGFEVIGEPFEVTRSEGARIYELDGTAAIPFLRNKLGLPETALRLEMGTLMYLAEELPRELHEEYGSPYFLRGVGLPVGGRLRLSPGRLELRGLLGDKGLEGFGVVSDEFQHLVFRHDPASGSSGLKPRNFQCCG